MHFVDFMSGLANGRRHISHAREYTCTQTLSIKICMLDLSCLVLGDNICTYLTVKVKYGVMTMRRTKLRDVAGVPKTTCHMYVF